MQSFNADKKKYGTCSHKSIKCDSAVVLKIMWRLESSKFMKREMVEKETGIIR